MKNPMLCLAFSFIMMVTVTIPLCSSDHEEVFTYIYDHAVWGRNDRGEGFSGGGSLAVNASPYMEFLQRFLKKYEIKSVVDAGCGDWEFSRYLDWSGIDYKGYEVVSSIVEKNKKKYSRPAIQFFHANCLEIDLPYAELLICKDVLQHLPNRDIQQFASQFSKFKYCLITNEVYPRTLSSDNPDIEIGGGHKVDLTQPPFNIAGYKVLTYYIGNSAHQVLLIDNSGNWLLR